MTLENQIYYTYTLFDIIFDSPLTSHERVPRLKQSRGPLMRVGCQTQCYTQNNSWKIQIYSTFIYGPFTFGLQIVAQFQILIVTHTRQFSSCINRYAVNLIQGRSGIAFTFAYCRTVFERGYNFWQSYLVFNLE